MHHLSNLRSTAIGAGNDQRPDVYLWRGLQGPSALNTQLSHSRSDRPVSNTDVPKCGLVVQLSEASSHDSTHTHWLHGCACLDDLPLNSLRHGRLPTKLIIPLTTSMVKNNTVTAEVVPRCSPPREVDRAWCNVMEPLRPNGRASPAARGFLRVGCTPSLGEQPTRLQSYGVKVPCRQLLDSDG